MTLNRRHPPFGKKSFENIVIVFTISQKGNFSQKRKHCYRFLTFRTGDSTIFSFQIPQNKLRGQFQQVFYSFFCLWVVYSNHAGFVLIISTCVLPLQASYSNNSTYGDWYSGWIFWVENSEMEGTGYWNCPSNLCCGIWKLKIILTGVLNVGNLQYFFHFWIKFPFQQCNIM